MEDGEESLAERKVKEADREEPRGEPRERREAVVFYLYLVYNKMAYWLKDFHTAIIAQEENANE